MRSRSRNSSVLPAIEESSCHHEGQSGSPALRTAATESSAQMPAFTTSLERLAAELQGGFLDFEAAEREDVAALQAELNGSIDDVRLRLVKVRRIGTIQRH